MIIPLSREKLHSFAQFLRYQWLMDGAHRRTLERALKVVHTKERLATALEMSLDELEIYLTGEKVLPNQPFLTALDIVANGKQQHR
jgi:hypothetical protein